jgi:hypothetical protein
MLVHRQRDNAGTDKQEKLDGRYVPEPETFISETNVGIAFSNQSDRRWEQVRRRRHVNWPPATGGDVGVLVTGKSSRQEIIGAALFNLLQCFGD